MNGMTNEDAQDIDRLDLNSAPIDALIQLPGVGKALAEKIAAGRPYGHVDDLRRVNGLGAAAVERLREGVWVDSRDKQTHSAPSPKPKPRAPSHPTATYSRRQVVGLLAASVALSVFLSIALTLAALLGINGTLDVSRARSVRNLETQTAQLADQVQALGGRLDAVDQRVLALQGLTGRMSDVESQTSQLADDVQSAQAETRQIGEQVSNLAATARDLNQRQSRLESVFQALANLLSPWADQSSSSNPTPTPGE
jgi:prefoldin subunit 5